MDLFHCCKPYPSVSDWNRVLNVISIPTTKNIAIEYIQKEKRKEFKHCIINIQLNTKEYSRAGSKGQKSYKAYRKNIIINPFLSVIKV